MRQLITVTDDHIKQGVKRECTLCPVALAIRSQLPDSNIDVYRSTFLIAAGHIIKAPESVRKFIDKFDKGMDVKPFSFYLEVTK